MQNGNHTLRAEEREQFWRQGYLGPYTLCSSEEMLNMHPGIEKVLETAPPDHNQLGHNRHLDSDLIHKLATHPTIVNRMASLYGPSRSLAVADKFFYQGTGGKGDSVAPRFQLLAP